MKEKVRVKCYLNYCDDTLGLARTKAEAWAQVNEFCRMSADLGLVVKASVVVAPIAHEVYGIEPRKKKKRRRQRSRRQKD